MADDCADTNVVSIGNCFVEVSRTKRKFTLVGFNDDLSKKFIPIVTADISIDLLNGSLIAHLNNNPLFHWGANYLILIGQDYGFVVAVHDVAKHRGVKQYTYADNQVVPIQFDKAIIYVPI